MFRWLHLSDIHVGMTDQDWLWPTFKHALFDDFKRLLPKAGRLDALIFSGDIAQFGKAAEYERFNGIFGEIREALADLGSTPPLIAVPGNHDLMRPTMGGPLEAATRQIPQDQDILRQVFEPASDYHTMLGNLFGNFVAWQEQMIVDGVHLAPTGSGALPGDFAFEVPFDGGTAGVVTLNSAWLQMAAGHYKGRLHVDPRQLNPATGGDPEAWCRRHEANLVVTHHPTDWFHPTSLSLWEGEVAPPGRFDVHLFGHMHEHGGQTTTHGGSAPRRALQAASLFGLEYIDGEQERSHGYSVCEIGNRDGLREIRVWPRTLRTIIGGERRIVPDHDLGLSEDNSFAWPLAERLAADIADCPATTLSLDEASKPDERAIANIEKLRYHLQGGRAHLAVRRIEREESNAALNKRAMLWISHDWGLGEDGFAWSVLAKNGEVEHPVYRLDFARYITREEYLAQMRAELGCGFEQVCEYLATLASAFVIFDNIPASLAREPGALAVEREVEDLANILREFAPTASVMLRGRPRVSNARLPVVELHPFEEADVADYVRAHEQGGDAYATADPVSKMWQHTGGSPVRLDAMLRDLEVTSLDDLTSSEPEYGTDVSDIGIPPALIGTLRELSLSKVPVWERSYQLLEALTALPRGERFERIRRFLGVHPFYPNHARELASRGLVETVQHMGLARVNAGAPARTLVVPRVVLDAVRREMKPARRRNNDRMAIELYFGKKWQAGEIVRSQAGKRCADPLCEPFEILNACALVERTVAQAREDDDLVKVENAVRLVSSFVEVLRKGDHFLAAAQLCERIIPLVPVEGNEQRIDVLRYSMGRAVRMLSQRKRALEIFQSIDRDNLSKSQRRSMDLQLALIHESLGDDVEAARWAYEVLNGGKTDGPALQAKSILAVQLPDCGKRIQELVSLEELARSINSAVVANNIALQRADYAKSDPAVAAEHLIRVIASADEDKDFHNGARAVIRLTQLRQKAGEVCAPDHINRLIRAYQHLHNERGSVLFNESHDALWSAFAAAKERENLLRLFRHSSLIWRLRGEEHREDAFIEKIDALVSERSVIRGLSRELAYYRSRAAASVERKR